VGSARHVREPEVTTEQAAASGPAKPAAMVPSVGLILLLQESAGNRAVASALHDRPDAMRRLSSWEANPATLDRWRTASDGETLPSAQAASWSQTLAADVGRVPVHRDHYADRLATAHDAAAVPIDGEVFLGSGAGQAVLGHELAHAAQADAGGPTGSPPRLEAEARSAGC
jgi:hypothetical protein